MVALSAEPPRPARYSFTCAPCGSVGGVKGWQQPTAVPHWSAFATERRGHTGLSCRTASLLPAPAAPAPHTAVLSPGDAPTVCCVAHSVGPTVRLQPGPDAPAPFAGAAVALRWRTDRSLKRCNAEDVCRIWIKQRKSEVQLVDKTFHVRCVWDDGLCRLSGALCVVGCTAFTDCGGT